MKNSNSANSISASGLCFLLFLISGLFITNSFFAQTLSDNHGSLYRFQFKNTPFPDKNRAEGHTYKDIFYDKQTHYNDSTTLVFVPKYYKPENDADIIVYFHGWNNNVDSVLSKFQLIIQLYSSKRQAILVMPEGPKNAPDSYGGKLEEDERFRLLIEEVMSGLSSKLNRKLTLGNITLAGHSGAYRVMAYILLRGGLTSKINEVVLFDALYGDTEKYSYWIDNYNGRFINIYTPDGGTKKESENLMLCLDGWNIPYTSIKGDNYSMEQLNSNRIIFIASSLGHNEVISSQNQLMKFLSLSHRR